MVVETSNVLAYIILCMTILGTITDVITIVVCLRRKLRKIPTFVFILFISVMYIITLYYSNLYIFYRNIYEINIGYTNEIICRTGTFSQIFSIQASSWLLVAVDVERCLSVKINSWRSKIFNAKKAVIVASVIVVVFFVINIDFIILTQFQVSYNQTIDNTTTTLTWCNQGIPLLRQHSQAHTYIGSIIPFIFICIANVILIHEIVFQKSHDLRITLKSYGKRKNLSVSIIILSFCFIIFTFPYAVVSGYFWSLVLSAPRVYESLVIMCDFYYSINFLILFISNKQFRNELINLFRQIKQKLCQKHTKVHNNAFS